MSRDALSGPIEPLLTYHEFPAGSGFKWPSLKWTQVELDAGNARHDAIYNGVVVLIAGLVWWTFYVQKGWPVFAVLIVWGLAYCFAYSFLFYSPLYESDPNLNDKRRPRRERSTVDVECWVDPTTAGPLTFHIKRSRRGGFLSNPEVFSFSANLEDIETFERSTVNDKLKSADGASYVENFLVLVHTHRQPMTTLAVDGGGAWRIERIFHVAVDAFLSRRPELLQQHRALARKHQRASNTRHSMSPETL
jgi:hypothetical protein